MKKIVWGLVPFVIIIFFVSQMTSTSDEQLAEFDKYWEGKHEFYRNSEASPFVQKGAEYREVEVFPFNSDYTVTAKLERYTSREIVTLANSDGTSTNYLKFANAKFKVGGMQQSILILKALGFGNQYLTAFGDATSGDTTYGGGRYLDLEIGKSDRIEIDFNKAYNPYCAYFADFTCPFPPRENLLTVAIKAGEKL